MKKRNLRFPDALSGDRFDSGHSGKGRGMKFIHLSDLHLGRRVNEFSMLEDQRDILNKLLDIVREEAPDGVLLAGDIYDKPVPSAEAVSLLDDFLVRLTGLGTRVYAISGNHDSPERMSFGGRLMERSGVHLAPVYGGQVSPIVLTDEYGPVYLYLLPFLKPVQVRRCFPEKAVETTQDALQTAIGAMAVDSGARNVLVAHQLVVGAERCESEEPSVGGTDGVDASVFAPFDYVALGHLHGPQKVGRETIRYCGTPLKYSFSEAHHHKSVTVVELKEKGQVSVRTVPLTPLREMREVRGSYEELTFRGFYQGSGLQESYLRITLTDEEDIPDAAARLRVIYPYLMRLDYDNSRTRTAGDLIGAEQVERKSPLELLEEFYAAQNGRSMSQEQRELAQNMIQEIWEGET